MAFLAAARYCSNPPTTELTNTFIVIPPVLTTLAEQLYVLTGGRAKHPAQRGRKIRIYRENTERVVGADCLAEQILKPLPCPNLALPASLQP
ncbi:hypothetical protein D3C77_234190 [compost metagenome]